MLYTYLVHLWIAEYCRFHRYAVLCSHPNWLGSFQRVVVWEEKGKDVEGVGKGRRTEGREGMKEGKEGMKEGRMKECGSGGWETE